MTTPTGRRGVPLGLDWGSTMTRAAYLHPGADRVVVPVPMPHHFRPVFPLVERVNTNKQYQSPWTPGLLQLRPDYPLSLMGRIRPGVEILTDVVQQTVGIAEDFAGAAVERVVLCHPLGVGMDGYEMMTQALQSLGRPGGLCSEATAVCAHFRAREMRDDEHATVLVFAAGYTGVGCATARITPRGVRLLAKAADQSALAGNALDYAIMQAALLQMEAARQVLIDQKSWKVWFELQQEAQAAKEAAWGDADVTVQMPETLLPAGRGRLRLVKPVFHGLVASHLQRALGVMAAVLDESGLNDADLNYVILFGGCTHLPPVQQALRDRFGVGRTRYLDLDAAAAGAALLAGDQALADAAGDGLLSEVPKFAPEYEADVPGLIEPLAAAPPPPASNGVAAAASPVDQMTLAELERRLAAGDPDALRDLRRLADAARTAVERHAPARP